MQKYWCDWWLDDALQNYIDVEAIGRDYLMDIDVTESGYMFHRG